MAMETHDLPEHEAVLLWAPRNQTDEAGRLQVSLPTPGGGERYVVRVLVQTPDGGVGEAMHRVEASALMPKSPHGEGLESGER